MNALRTVSIVPWPDMITTGSSGRVSRAFSSTANPSRSGMRTSITTTSTGRAAIFSSASRPPLAVSTAQPAMVSARESVTWMFFSSSTTSTRADMALDVNPELFSEDENL